MTCAGSRMRASRTIACITWIAIISSEGETMTIGAVRLLHDIVEMFDQVRIDQFEGTNITAMSWVSPGADSARRCP